MENKNLIPSIVLILVLSMSFALALHVLTPSTYDGGLGFSFNETIENLFNITINNTEVGSIANITQVNITIPSTFTFINGTNETDAVQELFENTTTELSWTNSTIFLINGTITGSGSWASFWFNASASTPGDYNITITTVNETGTTTLAQNISVQINDTTAPFNVSLDTGTPAANANLSQNYIIVNVTANDTDRAYEGALANITYYIYNSSLWATNITTNSNAVNFSGLADGVYYINATANDTLGNTNSTGTETRTITLDTTAPTASASCTPASVTQNSVVTCTCTGTDATSGVNTSSATTTPSTTSTGTYYYSCSVTDYAGNTATSTASYTVTGGSSGGGSSTISFWTKGTHAVTDEQFKDSFTKTLQVRQRLKVKVETLNHYVGVTGLTATTATINVSSDPQQATLIVGDERMFEVSGDEYYDILVKLNSIESSKANVTIQSIHELVTEDTTEAEEGLEDAGDAAAEEDEEAAATDKIENLWWYIGGVVIIILVIVGIIYAKKKK